MLAEAPRRRRRLLPGRPRLERGRSATRAGSGAPPEAHRAARSRARQPGPRKGQDATAGLAERVRASGVQVPCTSTRFVAANLGRDAAATCDAVLDPRVAIIGNQSLPADLAPCSPTPETPRAACTSPPPAYPIDRLGATGRAFRARLRRHPAHAGEVTNVRRLRRGSDRGAARRHRALERHARLRGTRARHHPARRQPPRPARARPARRAHVEPDHGPPRRASQPRAWSTSPSRGASSRTSSRRPPGCFRSGS